jgi:hypothetical protein
MRINHRIAARYDDRFWVEIDRLGLDYERGDPNNVLQTAISVLNITEDQPNWPKVERLVAEHDVGTHLVTLLYTKREIDAAEWLLMAALGNHGYPQPEDDFGYIEATYDVSGFCDVCGIGLVQKAPFRLRAEPKASHSQFVQLNWVLDELFVRSAAREGLTAAGLTGFEFRPVILHSKNRPSAQVEQMQIIGVLSEALQPTELATVTCKERNEEWESTARRGTPPLSRSERPQHCGRVKYHLMHRGPLRFDRAALAAAPDVVKSHEWFGSGASAFRLMLVSQRFRQVVQQARWRGLCFEPVELQEAPTSGMRAVQ